jgi:Ca2+-binding RTX toxin-like protein
VRRALLPLIATALLLAAIFPGTPAGRAAGDGEIVLHGASSGSHLRLAVNGSRLLVDGYLSGAPTPGCQAQGPGELSCALAGAASVVVQMGPADDKVEVLDPLPVPLTAYLGDGSDKLIGNDEADTCYPQGARRNRCSGEGGDGVCLAGPDNTDCVGGSGDDYCKTRDGSDGCWGGPGSDVCEMGAGEDGCHGEAGADRLLGGPGSDQLYGGPGRDYCEGGPGIGRSHECETGPMDTSQRRARGSWRPLNTSPDEGA